MRRASQSGYAMLLVFAMSAIIAIGMYEELPRVAFEAQRNKEQLLIDHGEQYKRGVQLYYRKLNRYPAKMEDLDNTQNIRFLRKHYFDPMTGKEEWRLLHMGPNGQLIDSKIKKEQTDENWHQGSITEFKSPASGSDDGTPAAANIGTRHRPSDDQVPGNDPNQPVALNPNGPAPGNLQPGPAGPYGQPGQPGQQYGQPGQPGQFVAQPPAWGRGGPGAGMPGQNQVPGGAPGAQSPPGTPNNAGSSSISGNGGYGSSISGNGGYGQPVNSQYQGQSPTPYPTAHGSNTQPGNAAQMINNLLTNPRPGGYPGGGYPGGGAYPTAQYPQPIGNAPTGGFSGASGTPGAPGAGFGTPVSQIGQNGTPGVGGTVMGGLAGVATTFKGKGVKRYNEEEEYVKWEFYYDLAKDASRTATVMPGAAPGAPGGLNGPGAAFGTGQPQTNGPGSNPGFSSGPGASSSSFGSGFGNSSGSGFGSGFGGNSGAGAGGPPPPPPPNPQMLGR